MELRNFTYLALSLILVVIPLLFSVRNKAGFFSKIKFMFPAILFSETIYVIWHVRFEELGIWLYNPVYLTGINIFSIPLEEVLFIFGLSIFPFFIYEWIKVKFQHFEKPNAFLVLSLILVVSFALLAFFSRSKLYTFFTFFLLAIYFTYTIFRNRFKKHYTKFYITFGITLIPYILLKSILFSLPVLSYENLHIIGIRIINVPLEDFGYFFLLLLMNTTIYEYLNDRQFY